MRNFNPRAPCGARPCQASSCPARSRYFNPRAPCGARPHHRRGPRSQARFQSTRPVRGATSRCQCSHGWWRYFNPRAPCGARLGDAQPVLVLDHISIHAPRAGRDPPAAGHLGRAAPFQSTRPVRGATALDVVVVGIVGISIHAPRAGRDFHAVAHALPLGISIHAPRAGRDRFPQGLGSALYPFQSTRPVRGATAKVYKITLHTFATKGNS